MMNEALAKEDVLVDNDQAEFDFGFDQAPATEVTVKASKNAVKNSAQLAQAGLQKLQLIGNELGHMFMEREAEIKSLLLGVLTARNVLYLGDPGTGKSDLTQTFASHVINSNYFQWLLNRTSDPSEILGPLSVKAMEKDQFLRKPEGKLPEADFAFLDEIFKGNSAVLNILLPLANEKIWYNDGKAVPARIKMIVGASNEFPEDEELSAFFDRFIFRHWVEYVADSKSQFTMLKNSVGRRNGSLQPSKTLIALEEIEAVQNYINNIVVPDGAILALQKLIHELRTKKSIKISDRRINICLHVMQATAALNGRTSADPDDMEHLAYVLWEKKEDIDDIQNEIIKMMNPFKDKINKDYKEALDVQNKVLNETDPTDRANAAIDARGVLEKIAKRMNSVINEATKEGRDVTEFKKKQAEVTQMNTEIVNKCLLFNVDDSVSDGVDDLPF